MGGASAGGAGRTGGRSWRKVASQVGAVDKLARSAARTDSRESKKYKNLSLYSRMYYKAECFLFPGRRVAEQMAASQQYAVQSSQQYGMQNTAQYSSYTADIMADTDGTIVECYCGQNDCRTGVARDNTPTHNI